MHHNDKDFRYLVEQSSIIDLGLVNLKDLLLKRDPFFKILSNENISLKSWPSRFIIKADWLNSNKILLPDDLINGVFVRTNIYLQQHFVLILVKVRLVQNMI